MQAADGRALGRGLRPTRKAAYIILALLALIPLLIFGVLRVSASTDWLDGAGGPMVAFSAGVLSFVSPCVLPIVPIYIANLAGASFDENGQPTASRGATFSHAVAFIGGLSVVFIALGASVGLIGYTLVDNQRTLEEVAGILLVAMGVLIVPELGRRSPMRSAVLLLVMTIALIGIVELANLRGDTTRLLLLVAGMGLAWAKFSGYLPLMSFLQRTFQFNPGSKRKVGYGRSALIGGAFATGWTPCVGPILGGILTLAATSGDAWTGAYLLGFYSLGFSVPFLMAGLAVSDASRSIRRIRPLMPYFEVIAALMLLAIGALLLSGQLTALNEFFTFAEFNQGL